MIRSDVGALCNLAAVLCLLQLACGEEGRPVRQMPQAEPSQIAGSNKHMLPADGPRGRLPGKADSYSDFRDQHPEWYGITNPPTVALRAAAEFEQMQRLLLAYTSTSLPAGIKQTLAAVVKHTPDEVAVYVTYGTGSAKNQFESVLTGIGVSPSVVNWVDMESDSLWSGDYGPISLLSTVAGTVGFADFRYFHQRIYDDALPVKVGGQWNITDYRVPLDFESGGLQVDPDGTCVASEGLNTFNGVDQPQIAEYLDAYLGCKKLIVLQTLANEGTTHISQQLKIVAAGEAILGKYEPGKDPANAQILDQNAAVLASNGFTVIRMPMPSNSDGAFRTHVNSLIINDINLVPVYSIDKDIEAEAMDIWEQVRPEWEHVGVDCDDLVQWAGSIGDVAVVVAAGTFQPLEANPAYACGGDWDCYPELEAPCNPDCGGKDCGADGCGGLCGLCSGNFTCQDFQCVCHPKCGGKDCGADGCGGLCGLCGGNYTCQNFQCVCLPKCAGSECGNDGCGGSCGSCPANESCFDGACKPGECEPDCSGTVCGDDGCDGSCGACGDSQICEGGACIDICQPDCGGKKCGGDGCDGSCGACDAGFSCNDNGACEEGCQPDCGGRECGDNGCGGHCGICPEDYYCAAAGLCEELCVSLCAVADCGAHGCDGPCGVCLQGLFCDGTGECRRLRIPLQPGGECPEDTCATLNLVYDFAGDCGGHGKCEGK